MATTWYIDPVGGNDGSAGTTFGTRCKLISALTAKGLAAGDTIRVIQTADPVDTTMTINVTNNSTTITLSAAVNADVDTCETAWTAGTNVTASTVAATKQGTNAITLAITGATTLMGYKATGTLDLSGYQQICFWFKCSATCAAGDFRLDLCTDTVGATAVHSVNVPALAIANSWIPVVYDTGGALNSAIKSVSLTRVAGSGTPTITLDNIFVAKAPGATALTLNTIIGTNTAPSDTTSGVKEWFRINSISSTALTISAGLAQGAAKWQGATNAAAPLYAFLPFVQASSSTFVDSIGVSGTTTARITIQGGYNTSDMTSVAGNTFWFQPTGTTATVNAPFGCINNRSFIDFSNMGFVGGGAGLAYASAGSNNINNTFTSCTFIDSAEMSLYLVSATGCTNNRFTNCLFQGGVWVILCTGQYVNFNNCRILHGTTSGVYLNSLGTSFTNCAQLGSVTGITVPGSATSPGSSLLFRGCAFTNNSSVDFSIFSGPVWLDNCALNASTEVSYGTNVGDPSAIFSTNHDRTVGNHQVFMNGAKAVSDATIRHTASGIAWRLSPTSTGVNSSAPMRLKIATVYCVSGVQTTVSAYFAKDHANISIGLRIIGGQLGGPASDTTQLSTCATTSTYESTATQIQWTPTSTGWVEIEAICYTSASTTSNGWVDDFGCVYG